MTGLCKSCLTSAIANRAHLTVESSILLKMLLMTYLDSRVEVQSIWTVPLNLLAEDAVVEFSAVLMRQELVDVEVGRAAVGEGSFTLHVGVAAAVFWSTDLAFAVYVLWPIADLG
jgi:hypothetical protein